MKIKEGYLLHEVAGNNIVIALGQEAVNFNGLLTISESGKILWELLARENGATIDEMLQLILEVYDVTSEVALTDIQEFLESLNSHQLLE